MAVGFTAYLIAALAVATLWSSASAVSSPRGVGAEAYLIQTGTIFGFVAAVAALPTLIVYGFLARLRQIRFATLVLAGFGMGAALFLLFFAPWASGPIEHAELIFYGGGLGLVGGLVFVSCKVALYWGWGGE